jgi:ParB-like chromosome segregation protein Spo0J
MPRVQIEDLMMIAADHLDDARVDLYSRILDEMPPVVVFLTAEGLLLADGYHRVAAARLLGRTTVEADIYNGSRKNALEFAIGKSGEKGISRDEALAAIQRRRSDRDH